MSGWWRGELSERKPWSSALRSSHAYISVSTTIATIDSRKSSYGAADSTSTATAAASSSITLLPRLLCPLCLLVALLLRLWRLASTSSSKSVVLVAYVAGPHESSTDEIVVAVAPVVLEVKAVAVDDDDACGDLGLVLPLPPRPHARDVSEE